MTEHMDQLDQALSMAGVIVYDQDFHGVTETLSIFSRPAVASRERSARLSFFLLVFGNPHFLIILPIE